MNSDDENPILAHHEVFYLEGLRFCTESALASVTWVTDLLERIHGGERDYDVPRALNQMQNIINQGGAISRFFWPSENKYQARGSALRKAFAVTNESPLKNRKLRNQVEHFDEYLDDYLKTVSAGVFTPHYFGPLPEEDGVPRHYFKAYYLDVALFEVLGRRYEIIPMIYEIVRIHNIMVDSGEGGRLPQQ